MSARRHPRRQALETVAVRVVAAVVRRLPWRTAQALGRGLGALWAALDPRHVGIATGNLRRAGWDEAESARVARGVYRHFAQVLLEILWLAGRGREDVLALVDWEGVEHVEAALSAGRGVILTTGHFGNWELHGLVHGWRFGAIGVVARPLDNPALDCRLCDVRGAGGNTVIYKKRALASVLRLLRAGQGVALLVDQNVEDGVFVDFFGQPASTTTVAAALAQKTGAALVPCRAERQPDGRYRVVYEPAVEAAPGAERGAENRRVTQELTRRIEGWARACPEQWLWIHRRWKTQPAAGAPPARTA